MALAEADLVIRRARSSGIDQKVYGIHLLSRLAVLNYVRIADEISATLKNGTILDWGCSFGQMSFLLKKRGLAVASYDLGTQEQVVTSPVFPELSITLGTDPIRIPYPSSSFDAVLSCGVLEHVANEQGSIEEIRRVLRKGGIFFIYNLPQRGSLKEFLIANLRLGFSHERKFTLGEARTLLETHHFQVVRTRRTGLLPQNLSPFPHLRGVFNRFAQPLSLLDRVLSAIPIINLTAEALEIAALKRSSP